MAVDPSRSSSCSTPDDRARSYRAILFDLDGTLVDSFPAIHASLTAAMEGVGIRAWNLETTKRHVGRGIEYLVCSAVGEERKEEALRLFLKDYRKNSLERTHLLPSVAEILPELYRRGYRLAVTTNKSLAFTRPILRHLGVEHLFGCVLGPEEVARPKPYPDMLLEALNRLGLDRSDALYVGDMPLDVETASGAGLDCVLVATGPYPYSVLKEMVPVPVLRRLGDLFDHISRPPINRSP